MTPEQQSRLGEVLSEARELGFLGPGPVMFHVEHALNLARALDAPPGRCLDLGSGAGLPGLPLAWLWEGSHWVLLDGSVTRAAFLERAVAKLELTERVDVVAARAESAGHGPLRGSFDLVTARSFAGPGVTAECGSPFVKVGGTLLVAEPPGGQPARWDPNGLQELGLEIGPAASTPTAYQCLVQAKRCPDRYPRRVGVPAKRPLF